MCIYVVVSASTYMFFLDLLYICMARSCCIVSLSLSSLYAPPPQSADRTACVWDVRSGECVMRFEGHESSVNAVCFFPTGEALGTACNDGSVSGWGLWVGRACGGGSRGGTIYQEMNVRELDLAISPNFQ